MHGRGGEVGVADSMAGRDGWAVGSPAFGRGCARMAFALSLFGVGGLAGVAVDLLHIPALLGNVVSGRAALCCLAWFCTVGSVVLGTLCIGLQRADVHTGSGEVTR